MSKIIKVEQQHDPNRGRAFNQWTRNHDDLCEYENQERVGSKPMKYFVNQLNTPQGNQFTEFTTVGNQQVYGIQNNFEHSLPTRLNPLYQTYVFPYSTTPFLGQSAPSREYTDTESNLRFGNNVRNKKSAVASSELDFNRWDFVSAETVQNAGQFGGSFQSNAQGMARDNQIDYKSQNNILFGNGAWPHFGISSRNELHNYQQINKC